MSRVKAVVDCVSAFVFRRDRGRLRFLLMKRSPSKGGFWQSVSGTMERGELPEATAAREVREETGLAVKRLHRIDYLNCFYEGGRVHLEPCFGAEVGSGVVRMSREHVEDRWVGAREALKLLKWRGNRAALRALVLQLR